MERLRAREGRAQEGRPQEGRQPELRSRLCKIPCWSLVSTPALAVGLGRHFGPLAPLGVKLPPLRPLCAAPRCDASRNPLIALGFFNNDGSSTEGLTVVEHLHSFSFAL